MTSPHATCGGADLARISKPGHRADFNGFVRARADLGSGAGDRLVRYTLRVSRLTYAHGSSRWNSPAGLGPQLGSATVSSLDGSESHGARKDAGVRLESR